jgi:hypothetical protein
MIPPHPKAIYQETEITKIYELPRVTSVPVPTFQAQRKASATTQTFTLCRGFGGRLGQKSPAEKITIPHGRRRDFG